MRVVAGAGLFDMWTRVETPAVLDYVGTMGEYGFAHWSRAGREIAASFDREGTPLSALRQLADRDEACPTLHVYAQPPADEFLAAQAAYAETHPWFRVQRLDAHSHFPRLEIPEQLAALIDVFLTSIGGRPAERVSAR